jgi:acetyl esterase/lipase
MREMTALIRANNTLGDTDDIAAMRENMETAQAQMALPEDVSRDEIEMAGRPGCIIKAPGAREDYIVLYLHGGGYVMGSPNTHQELMGRISRSLAATVYGLDYRLAPEHPWPAAVDDAVAAWEWLLDAGMDPRKSVVAGDSAGGGLAAALLLALRGSNVAMPAGAVLFSPWTDLTASGDSVKTRAEADPMISGDNLAPMAAHYYGTNAPDHPSISPLFGDLAGLCPLLVQVGDAEVLLDDSTRFHEKARAAGVDSTLHVFDEAFHVFQAVPVLPEAEEALNEMREFLERVTRTDQ